jgi:hypothetical protein
VNDLTPEQALQVLDRATQPGVVITRQDYCVIEQALAVLSESIKPKDDKPDGSDN